MTASLAQSTAFASLLATPWTNPAINDVNQFTAHTPVNALIAVLMSKPTPDLTYTEVVDNFISPTNLLGPLAVSRTTHTNLITWTNAYLTLLSNRQPAAMAAMGLAEGMDTSLAEFGDTVPAGSGPNATPQIIRLSYNAKWSQDMVGTITGHLLTGPGGFADAALAYTQLSTYVPTAWNNYVNAIASATTAINALVEGVDFIDPSTFISAAIAAVIATGVPGYATALIAASATLVSHPSVLRNPIVVITSHSTRVDEQITREKLWWTNLTPTFSDFSYVNIIATAAGTALALKSYTDPNSSKNAGVRRLGNAAINDAIDEGT
jgi:hypothetical protein